MPGVLAAVPPGYRVLVVDNGSQDGTSQVARAHGATVVTEPRRGYGAAVQAGIAAAPDGVVGFLDGDGSMDPADLSGLVDALANADLVVGRRVAVGEGVWPLHARIGNRLLAMRLRRRYRLDVHDIGAMRVARRSTLLALGPLHPRFGYPLDLLVRSAQAGLTVVERDIVYRNRTHGRSKVSGSWWGTAATVRDFWAVR